MKKLVFPFLITATLLLSAFSVVNALQWRIGDGYAIKFSSDHLSGVFTSLKGTILFDPAELGESKFDVVVDVNSINTGIGLKNKHARSDQWFDAEKYPEIKFNSGRITAVAGGFEALGTLEMHGIAKDFTMPFTFADSTFTSSFEVNRVDFKIGSTEGMSGHVPTTIRVDVSVPVTR